MLMLHLTPALVQLKRSIKPSRSSPFSSQGADSHLSLRSGQYPKSWDMPELEALIMNKGIRSA